MYRGLVLFLQSLWAVGSLVWMLFVSSWQSERRKPIASPVAEQATLELLEDLDSPLTGFWDFDGEDWLWCSDDQSVSIWIGRDDEQELRCVVCAEEADQQAVNQFAKWALEVVALSEGAKDLTNTN